MKVRWVVQVKERRICAAYESTQAPLTRSPFPIRGRLVKSPSHQSLHDTKERISSHAWYEILRLSPHLFWLGLFTHRAFSSAQDDDTRGVEGFSSGRYVACFGTIGVIYDTSRPLEKGRAEGAGWIHEAV